eukprot:XP_016657208.1 PREDICTED: chymotrypsin-1-like [Acyrthosiphon pisum]
MKIAIISSLLIIVALFEHNSTFHFNNGLVYKGTIFKSNDYPYVMYLRMWDKNRTKEYVACTASLVKSLFILTAGHCCNGYTVYDLEVCQGSPLKVKSIDFHRVAKIYLHQNYSLGRNDICVLKLEKQFPNIKTFLKIGGSSKDFEHGKKLNCRIFGFGLTGDEKTAVGSGLTITSDIVYGREACQQPETDRIKENWKQYLCLVPKNTTNDPTTCLGDSGGPMVCNEKQYGICCFVYSISEDNNISCGALHQQSVFIFVNAHRKWLNNIIEPKKKKRSSGNLLKPRHTFIYLFIYFIYLRTNCPISNIFTIVTL